MSSIKLFIWRALLVPCSSCMVQTYMCSIGGGAYPGITLRIAQEGAKSAFELDSSLRSNIKGDHSLFTQGGKHAEHGWHVIFWKTSVYAIHVGGWKYNILWTFC